MGLVQGELPSGKSVIEHLGRHARKLGVHAPRKSFTGVAVGVATEHPAPRHKPVGGSALDPERSGKLAHVLVPVHLGVKVSVLPGTEGQQSVRKVDIVSSDNIPSGIAKLLYLGTVGGIPLLQAQVNGTQSGVSDFDSGLDFSELHSRHVQHSYIRCHDGGAHG